MLNNSSLFILTHLNRGGTKHGLAPHKPILLLALIDTIEETKIQENKIPIDSFLSEKFTFIWLLLVDTTHNCDIMLPLFYLQNDGFWKVIKKDGTLLKTKRAISKLRFGTFDDDFFQLILNPDTRPIIKMVILDTYFPRTKQQYLSNNQLPNYISDIEATILEEQVATYRKITSVKEGYVRDWKFRANIMRLYDNSCCISGFKIEPNHGLIEACHIKQHAKHGIDTITNGIPLSINLHRAFDAGFISISNNYTVILKKESFNENTSPFSLGQFAGKKILLPEVDKYYPNLNHLRWHRQHFNF